MARSLPPLEVWAGVECTHNRVGDDRHDQLDLTGHADRVEDIDRLADLGVAAVRYPVLWERVCGDDGTRTDWSWSDGRLARLRERGVRPVVGLLHHGAGPGDAGFADPAFAERFAAYARAVAERYPWVTEYIPVNEPLTTARFCGLYGFWHPHAQDTQTFARILLAQLRGTILAMRAIREVNPDAVFIQNEDAGTAQAVEALRYEAEFQNERRWTTFDLLCGRLEPGMTMWDLMRGAGVDESELRWFQENPCPPDVIAVDNYVTSDRFLDDRLDRYPPWSHSTNGRDRYADIEAVRVTDDEPPGVLPLLREAWRRYGRPVAIGEAHLGSTREEQLRWLRDMWAAADLVRAEGIDMRSITVWAAFGLMDWNSLVRERNDYYEPGLFDVRSGRARPTALAGMVRTLARGERFDHPVLGSEGWWRRPERLTFPATRPAGTVASREPRIRNDLPRRPRTIALVGRGPLLEAFERVCAVRALPTVRLVQGHGDVHSVQSEVHAARAWAVVDLSTCLPSGEIAGGATDLIATHGGALARTRLLSRAVRRARMPQLLVSCHHAIAPGSGAAAERCSALEQRRAQLALSLHPRTLVLRPGTLLDPWDPEDPLVQVLRDDRAAPAFERSGVVAAYVPDLVNAALDLLIDDETGSWYGYHDVMTTWSALTSAVTEIAADDVAAASLTTASHVPSAPSGARMHLPKLVDALSRFVHESEPLWRRRVSLDPADVVELDSAPGFEYPASKPASTLSRAEDAG